MRLIETTQMTSADFPIAAFKDQLRLGTGFVDGGAQDGLLETYLRAAMGAIEARTNKILILRRFQWQFSTWRRDGGAQALPVSPISSLLYLRMIAANGSISTVNSDSYRLILDDQRPKIVATTKAFPEIETGGAAEISFFAGFGNWSQVPADLQQAMMMLATSYYENRDSMVNGGGQIPFGVAVLLEPHKRIRLGAAP